MPSMSIESQLEFSPQARQKIEALCERYPSKQPVVLAALHLAQKEFGHLSDDALRLVARTLDLPYTHVYGVATFYTMFRREPAGKNVLRVCTNVSCMLRGAYDVLAGLEKRLGIEAGGSKGDFHLVEEECIAACANAPAILCGTTLLPRRAGLAARRDHRLSAADPPSRVGGRVMPADFDVKPEVKIVTQHFGNEHAKRIDGYEQLGGYQMAPQGARAWSRADDPRRGQEVEPARPRRRRLPDRREVGLRAQGRQGRAPGVQRRRVRARHLQGPRAALLGSAPASSRA